MRFDLPSLPYAYDALEPHIDARTMEIHHTKHHQAYTDGLNKALESPEAGSLPKTIEEILSGINKVPESIRGAVNFHGGGYDNHCIYWKNMSPDGGGEPEGEVKTVIDNIFGSFAEFKEKFSKAALGIQGSGWAWLVHNSSTNKIELVTMPNQTSPRTAGLIPVLGLDMWEHSWYLLRQNRKSEYVEAWWNLVNWQDVEERLKTLR